MSNVSALIGSISALNPSFSVDSLNSWTGDLALGPNNEPEPIIVTNITGAWVAFPVNSSVGFALYGANDIDQGNFIVDIDPAVPNIPNSSTTYQFNAMTPWMATNQLRYLATGLDRTQYYTVRVTNAEAGKQFNMGEVVLFDAVPAYALSILCQLASEIMMLVLQCFVIFNVGYPDHYCSQAGGRRQAGSRSHCRHCSASYIQFHVSSHSD